MAANLNIAVLVGSLRAGSYNRMLANALPALAPEGMGFEIVEGMGELPIYSAELEAKGFPPLLLNMAERIAAADGVMIVTPEYNHSLPGGLKNQLDWLSRLKDQPFSNKAVAIQSASPGAVGGARAQQHLRHVLVFLNAFVLNRPEIIVGKVQDKVNAQGELTDEATRKYIGKQLQALAELIARVKA